MSDYRFPDAENTACMVCSHVLEERVPILRVTHDDEDGMWQFLCGAPDHESHHAKIIALVQAVELDPSVNELNEMPCGDGATREAINAQWQPFKL